jgi:aspartate racemase
VSELIAQRFVPGILAMAVNTDLAYYRAMNEQAEREFGCRPNALRIVLHKIDFAAFIGAIQGHDAYAAEALIADGLERLRAGGADFAVVTANAAAPIAARLATRIDMPVLRITEPVCRAMAHAGVARAGLLAVGETYRSRIYQAAANSFGIDIIEPSIQIASSLEGLIFNDLIHGRFTEAGVDVLRTAIAELENRGADAVILGCTDLTHLAVMIEDDHGLPVFDSARLHALAAVECAHVGLQNRASVQNEVV